MLVALVLATVAPSCRHGDTWIEQEVPAPEGAGQVAWITRVRRGPEDLAIEVELHAPGPGHLRADLSAAVLEVQGLQHLPLAGPVVTLGAGQRQRRWLRYHLGRPLRAPATLRLLDLHDGGAPMAPVALPLPAAPGTEPSSRGSARSRGRARQVGSSPWPSRRTSTSSPTRRSTVDGSGHRGPASTTTATSRA